MVVSQGYDSLIYAVGTLAGWPLLLLLLAEKLRERGCFTVADVLAQRFPEPSVRIMWQGLPTVVDNAHLNPKQGPPLRGLDAAHIHWRVIMQYWRLLGCKPLPSVFSVERV